MAVENDADIVACGHIREYSKKSKVRSVSDIVKTVTPDEALKMVVEDRHLQNHVWSKIYRRRLFNEVRFPVGEIYEDIAVSHLLLHQANRVVLVDKSYYHYRIAATASRACRASVPTRRASISRKSPGRATM